MTKVAGPRDGGRKNEMPLAAAVTKPLSPAGAHILLPARGAQRWAHRVVLTLDCVHGTIELVSCCLHALDASVYDVLAMQVSPPLSLVPRSITPCPMSWHGNILRPIFETGGTLCHSFMHVRKLHSETTPPYTLAPRQRN